MNDDEKEILDLLCCAWKKFYALPIQHSDAVVEFRLAIRAAQKILGMRVACRCHPDFNRMVADSLDLSQLICSDVRGEE